jgi:trk system potassium uptake protein TrkH
MNIKQVARVISILLLTIAFFMLIPFFMAFYDEETEIVRSFLVPIGAIIFISVLIFFFTRNNRKESISTRDGFLLVSLSWILASLFSCLPFYLSGTIPRFVDCFFETMSGYTTTGASILTHIEALPRPILFWRSFTHWLGGMGIVVLTVAIFPLLGVGGLQLIKAEAPGPTVDKITPKVTETAKILWITYCVLTVAETFLLMGGGMSLFDSLTHTFGTLATGGFSPKDASVGHYNSAYIDVVITAFMLMAGTNFILYFRLVSGKLGSVVGNTELKVYLGIWVVSMVVIAFSNYGRVYDSIAKSFRFAGFQAATILTTTGFVTTNYAEWPKLSQAVLFILMFIGGCSGSTGGGIKVMRIVTLFKQGWNEMKSLIYPRGIFQIKMSGRTVTKEIVYAISGFVFLYLFLILITTLVVATGGNDILTSIATALVTLGNIGPGFGRISPAGNYAFYPDYIKWYLSFIMMAGRLEIYTVLVLLTPKFWKK